MKDSTREALDEALDENEEIKEERRQERESEENEQQRFVQQFASLKDEDILPVLREIGEYLEERGHSFRIRQSAATYTDQSDDPDPAISFLLYAESIPRSEYGSELPPGVTFTAKRITKKVSVHTRNMVPGTGGQAGPEGKYEPEEVDSELIENIVTDTVSEILENAAQSRHTA